MDYKLKLLKQGFQNIGPYILSEIYTSECRIMQLRIFVKTKFSGEHAPDPPPLPSQTSRLRRRFVVYIASVRF